MSADLSPEQILDALKQGRPGRVYLFYGPDEFRMEKVLSEIRETLIPESARDFNIQIFYGEAETNLGDIADAACSLPFLSTHRLVIVRRTEKFPGSALEKTFIPYIENPLPSTWLIFVAAEADFRLKFYNRIRKAGGAVHFKPLYDRQVIPWLRRFATELGLNITEKGCVYLQGIVGNHLRDLYGEMEKLRLRYGTQKVGEEKVKELAVASRIYTIFELMDEISLRRHAQSLAILNRYLEEEGRDAPFKIVGMLNRQIRLIIQAKSMAENNVKPADVSKKLQVVPFLANKLIKQAQNWRTADLEHALHLLYRADKHLKTGAQPRLILEHLLLSL